MDVAKAVAVAAIVASPLVAGATEGTNEVSRRHLVVVFLSSGRR